MVRYDRHGNRIGGWEDSSDAPEAEDASTLEETETFLDEAEAEAYQRFSAALAEGPLTLETLHRFASPAECRQLEGAISELLHTLDRTPPADGLEWMGELRRDLEADERAIRRNNAAEG